MTKSQNVCPVCGEGHLHDSIDKNKVEYKGQTTELDMLYSVCDVCGSDQSASAQLLTNKRTMIAFKKQVDGLMAGEQVRALRERLGINQAEAAKIFGGGPVAFSKYESDDVAQSAAMDKLLRLALAVPGAFNKLAHESGILKQNTSEWGTLKIKQTKIAHPFLRVISSSQPETHEYWKKVG